MNYNKFLPSLLFLFLIGGTLFLSSYSVETKINNSPQNKTGSFTDSRDGQTYNWVRLRDGNKWMSEDLNYKSTGSWCYDDNIANCQKYGRLYTWEKAKTVCPSGWRLPSDKEWTIMARHYNPNSDSDKNSISLAYKDLIKGGTSGFSVTLGGYRNSDNPSVYNFYAVSLTGYYWSSSERSSIGDVWSYHFDLEHQDLWRSVGPKNCARSCRCIQKGEE